MHQDAQAAFAQGECAREAIVEPAQGLGAALEAVDDGVHAVAAAGLQLHGVVQLQQFTVESDAHQAGPAQTVQKTLLGAFALLQHGREEREPGAFGQGQQAFADGLCVQKVAAALEFAHTGVEQPQKIADLAERAHGGAGTGGGAVLVHGHGGTEALDGVHVRLAEFAQELAGLSGKALHVATAAFGEERIEGQAALA